MFGVTLDVVMSVKTGEADPILQLESNIVSVGEPMLDAPGILCKVGEYDKG
jgi:hypothetical protein